MWLIKLPQPHAPLYQLKWANSGFKPAITLLTTLENSWKSKATFIQNAVLTRETVHGLYCENVAQHSILDFFSRESETIGLE